MVKILFVCTQNVFRSMSAHFLMEKYLQENNIYDFEVESAGTIAHSWEKPYQKTLQVLFQLGADARNHINQKIDEEIINSADLIVCMSQHHIDEIENKYNKESYLFNEIAHGNSTDLQDDVEAEFTSLEDFIEEIVLHINKSIPNIVENINDYLD